MKLRQLLTTSCTQSPKSSAIALILLLTLFSATTQAASPISSALESSVGRFLLGETAEGMLLSERVFGHRSASVDELISRLHEPRYAFERAELEERVGRVRDELRTARKARYGEKKAEPKELTEDERFVLKEVAAHELRVDAGWESADLRGGEIEFIGGSKARGLTGARPRFLEPKKAFDPSEGARPLEEASESIQNINRQSFSEWYKESQACLRDRPKSESNRFEWRYMLEQQAIASGITTGGNVITHGISRVTTGGFWVDMVMTWFSTGMNKFFLKSSDTFRIRWIKVTAWGLGRSKLDAMVYSINPWIDTHGVPMEVAAHNREIYNYKWNTLSSWTNPTTFTILNGMECLIKKNEGAEAAEKFGKKAFAIRTGIGATNATLFYQLRERLLGQ